MQWIHCESVQMICHRKLKSLYFILFYLLFDILMSKLLCNQLSDAKSSFLSAVNCPSSNYDSIQILHQGNVLIPNWCWCWCWYIVNGVVVVLMCWWYQLDVVVDNDVVWCYWCCDAINISFITVTPYGNSSSGTFTKMKNVKDIFACTKLCCLSAHCDVVFFYNTTCYHITCKSQALCQPVKRLEFTRHFYNVYKIFLS